jgi:hypothetical protein
MLERTLQASRLTVSGQKNFPTYPKTTGLKVTFATPNGYARELEARLAVPVSASSGHLPIYHELLRLGRGWRHFCRSVPWRQRRGTRRRRAIPGANVGCPALFVFHRRQAFQFTGTAGHGLLMQLPEKGNAPTTASAGSAALGELAGNLRSELPDEIRQFAARDVKAVTDFRILIHWARFRGVRRGKPL